jgi:hypothetical protein
VLAVVVGVADLDADAWPVLDHGVLAEQEVVEERPLRLDLLGLVVVGPLLAPMDVEPLLARRHPPEPVEGAAGVQGLVRPAGQDERGHPDLFQPGTLRPERVVERARRRLRLEVLDLGDAGAPALPDVGPERGLRDAPVPGDLPVGLAPPLPRVDRREVRRVEFGDPPLRHRHVRDPGQPDLPGAPRLGPHPLDQVGERLRLLRRAVGRRPSEYQVLAMSAMTIAWPCGTQ